MKRRWNICKKTVWLVKAAIGCILSFARLSIPGLPIVNTSSPHGALGMCVHRRTPRAAKRWRKLIGMGYGCFNPATQAKYSNLTLRKKRPVGASMFSMQWLGLPLGSATVQPRWLVDLKWSTKLDSGGTPVGAFRTFFLKSWRRWEYESIKDKQ
jgi:hypothetical protein